MTRRYRIALIALVALAAVVCALGAAAWWAARSETAFAWITARIEGFTGGRLRIESPRGSLAGTIGASRVVYADADVRVTATEVALDLRLGALLREQADASSLSAKEVRIEILPTPSTGPPDSIGVPVAIAVHRFEVGSVTIVDGSDKLEFRELAGAYRGGPGGHRIELTRARTPWGEASGMATLGAERPFPVEGGVRFTRATAPWSVDATAGLAGTLLSMNVRIDGRVGTAPIEGELGLAPFEDRWLARARATARDVDFGAFVPEGPRTAATIRLNAASGENGGYAGDVAIENAEPGTVTAGRVPLANATSKFAFDGNALRLTDLVADLGVAGRARGEGEIDIKGNNRWNLVVDALNLRGLHAPLRETRLTGKVVARLDDVAQHVDIDVREKGIALVATATREGDRVRIARLRAAAGASELAGEGTVSLAGSRPFEAHAKFSRFDPARFGDWPTAALNGDFTATGALEPAWRANVRFRLADSRFRGAPLSGSGVFAASPQGVRNADVSAMLGANRIHAQGGFGTPGDSLALDVDARNLAQLDPRAAGRIVGQATIAGGTGQPAIAFDLRGERLAWSDERTIATLVAKGEVAARAERPIDVAVTAAGIDAVARFEGEWDGARGWRGTIARLENRGDYAMALAAPARLEIGADRIALGEATVRAFDGELAVHRLAWANGRLSTAGRLRGMPAAPLLAAAGWKPERGTDLALRGEWSLDMERGLNGVARVERERGDIVVGSSPALPLGLSRLAVDAKFVDDAVTAAASVEAANLGEAALEATSSGLARDARLAGRVTANVATLRLLDEMVGTAAIIDGRAALDLALGGTVGAPSLGGTASAEGVRVDVPQYGIALRDGRMRASLKGDELVLEALSIRGPEGELTASGTLARGGEGAKLAWRAERLRIFNRPDRRLVVSGAGTSALSRTKLALRGELRAEEGYIEFAGQDPGRLGDDVVIVGRTVQSKRAGPRALPLDVDLTLDPGQRFRIVGQGLDAYLRGKVRVQSRPDGTIVAIGTIDAVNGSYRAFGQKLDIERGRLIFDGPIDNPALDVLALRRNLQVEAGVEVTGTARAPQVRLTSRPPVPDAEKLSWLVLGRASPDASSADLALLQAAAAQLVTSDQAVPVHRRIIQGIGLDDIAVRGAAGGTASGQVVAFGKRVSDRLYIEYEQGLTVAANLVRLTFALTRTLSVNATTSQTTSSVGFTYRRAFD
jgi:translocation and assembly module TamB